jgi:hypothetical protein
MRFLRWVVDSAPVKRFEHLHHIAEVSNETARQLVEKKTAELAKGITNRDLMSIVIKSNAEEDPRGKLTEYEMLSQLR